MALTLRVLRRKLALAAATAALAVAGLTFAPTQPVHASSAHGNPNPYVYLWIDGIAVNETALCSYQDEIVYWLSDGDEIGQVDLATDDILDPISGDVLGYIVFPT